MSTVEGDIVLTQDDSSGTIHRRVRLGSGLATFEGCNLDTAGAYTVLPDIGHARVAFSFCRRCFPEDQPEPTVSEGWPV